MKREHELKLLLREGHSETGDVVDWFLEVDIHGRRHTIDKVTVDGRSRYPEREAAVLFGNRLAHALTIAKRLYGHIEQEIGKEH